MGEFSVSSLKPWGPSEVPKDKVVSVRCLGLPLHLWRKDCFENLVNPVEKIIIVDEKTDLRHGWIFPK